MSAAAMHLACYVMSHVCLALSQHDLIEPLRQPGSFCGLKNGGATCYMNSVIQQLFMQPRVRALMLGARPVPREEQADSLFAQLQLLMANLAFSCAGSIKPDAFWRSVKVWKALCSREPRGSGPAKCSELVRRVVLSCVGGWVVVFVFVCLTGL